MTQTLQQYLAKTTQKACDDLLTAFGNLPEDKRSWSPMGDARTASDQIAECAILNSATADLMKTHSFDENFDYAGFQRRKEELAADWNALKAELESGTAKAIATILEVPDEDLPVSVDMPWGAMTMSQIIAYPAWNMNYHEAQINYMASMLGCLK